MQDDIYVLYHSNCPDGFGAAAIARGQFGDDAHYLPVQYGEPLPEIPDGSTVYILDFSYDRETLIALAGRSKSLTVLDHHRTARDALAGLDFAHFDMSKSGAMMTWEHFHPGRPAPPLVAFIQDRDLWRWELPDSREVSAWLSIQERKLSWWSRLIGVLDEHVLMPERWITEGKAILAFQRIQTSSLCDHAITVGIAGHAVPAVNSPILQSEIGEELCKRNADAPFAAAWFCPTPGSEVWSLRSRNGFDVSAVAKSFGGGGHPAAAGFRVTTGTIQERKPS